MLNVTQIKNLKPTDKRKKYAMGGGMYIEVMPNGKMTWRLKFRWDGAEQIFTIGDLKVVSLAQAQLAREQAKALLRDGINPNSQKKASLAQDKAAMPLNELLSIYIDKAVPTHKGAKWEVLRLEKFRRDFPELMTKPVNQIDQLDIIDFRNKRSKQVAPASVNREMNLLGGLFRYAVIELRIISESPLKNVTKPTKPPHRERRPAAHEIELILQSYNYDGTTTPINKRQQTAWAFIFAIETAMRASEITGLTWANVFNDHVLLTDTKNGTARRVPLTDKAASLLKVARGIDDLSVLTIAADSLSTGFTKRMKELGIIDLRFHDSRHEATTRLAQILPIQDLAKVTGHKTLNVLMGYYNPTASELASRMNKIP